MSTGWPSSAAREVTSLSAMPHGIISSNQRSSVFTFSARPWVVTPRLTRTPMAASLRLALDPDADQALLAMRRSTPKAAAVSMMAASRRADVAAQVERVAQLDDGIGDQLARAVEGDVAAAVHAQELRPSSRSRSGSASRLASSPPRPMV